MARIPRPGGILAGQDGAAVGPPLDGDPDRIVAPRGAESSGRDDQPRVQSPRWRSPTVGAHGRRPFGRAVRRGISRVFILPLIALGAFEASGPDRAVAPSDVYVGTSNDGVYRSDGGSTWSPMSGLPPDTMDRGPRWRARPVTYRRQRVAKRLEHP